MADKAATYGEFIRPFLPEQHRAFYSSMLNLLYIGARDQQGRVWASVLAGAPGFITSDGPNHLAIAPGSQLPADPAHFVPGSSVGGLGLDMATRRRNRVNATATRLAADGTLHLRAEQTVGNCPKYIQTRHVRLDAARLAALQRGESGGDMVDSTGPLGEEQLALIRGADTFFLATCGSKAAPGPAPAQPHAGCDVSHRGGPPGFVECGADGLSLQWPDYAGNSFFMSLGNLHVNPSAGLLFIDWLSGGVLQLSGTAEIAYDDRSMPGAQRAVRFRLAAWHWAPTALPIHPAPVLERSPYNPRLLGSAAAPAAHTTAVECVGVAEEAAGTFSFRAPPGFSYAAGQFASFDFEVAAEGGAAGATRTLHRTWTLSSHPADAAAGGAFTITVKRAGLMSGWLHDSLRPGMELQLRGVGGEFVVRQESMRPVLLLAGGIGITPMRVMFQELVRRQVPAALLYSVRRPEEAAFLPELTRLAQRASEAAAAAAGNSSGSSGGGGGSTGPGARPAYRVLVTATGGGIGGGQGWRSGRVDAALVREAVGDPAACDVYMCGPGGFMDAATALLEGLGVDPANIHTESFDF